MQKPVLTISELRANVEDKEITELENRHYLLQLWDTLNIM